MLVIIKNLMNLIYNIIKLNKRLQLELKLSKAILIVIYKSNYFIKNDRRYGLLGTKNCENVSDSIFIGK